MFSGPAPTASPAWHVRRKPEPPCGLERRRERPQVDAELGRIRPEADEPLPSSGSPQRAHRFDELDGRRGPERAIGIGDERARGRGRLRLSGLDPVGQPGDDVRELAGRRRGAARA